MKEPHLSMREKTSPDLNSLAQQCVEALLQRGGLRKTVVVLRGSAEAILTRELSAFVAETQQEKTAPWRPGDSERQDDKVRATLAQSLRDERDFATEEAKTTLHDNFRYAESLSAQIVQALDDEDLIIYSDMNAREDADLRDDATRIVRGVLRATPEPQILTSMDCINEEALQVVTEKLLAAEAALLRLREQIEMARCAFADIGNSADMNLTLARKKAKRIYRELAPPTDQAGVVPEVKP